MKRGFTIIELLVVITVIAILVGIFTLSMYGHENRASDSQARALLAAVRSGTERYYSDNNEYPLATALYGGSIPGSCAAPASYTTASSMLGVQAATLGGDRIDLAMCASSVSLSSSSDLNKVYYVTKPTASDATAYTVTIGGCTYTLKATDIGNLSYLMVYYNKQFSAWQVTKSAHGAPSSSDNFWCPFVSSF